MNSPLFAPLWSAAPLSLWHLWLAARPVRLPTGRWTPHLIRDQRDFSIFQLVCGNTVTNWDFYYFSALGGILCELLTIHRRHLDCFAFLLAFYFPEGNIGRAPPRRSAQSLFLRGSLSSLLRTAWERLSPGRRRRQRSRETQQCLRPKPTDRSVPFHVD